MPIANAANKQISVTRTVTKISAYNNFVYVLFTPGQSNSQGCTNSSTARVTIDTANEVGKNMVSTILTAAAAGKQVGFGINGCMHNSPQVYRVEVIF